MSLKKIWVDADACPKVIKEILFRAADRVGIPLTLVANQQIPVPGSHHIRSIQVAGGSPALWSRRIIATSAAPHIRLLLVTVRDASGNQGWGECPITSQDGDPGYSLMRDTLRHDILPAFASGTFDDLQSVADTSQALLRDLPVSSYRAHCGAELAMLDLMGRRQMKSSHHVYS